MIFSPWRRAMRLQRRHVRGLAELVHRHDRPRLAGNDRFFDARGIDVQGPGIDIDKRHAEPAIQRRRGAGDERQVRDDDFAAVGEAIVIEDAQPARCAARRCRAAASGRDGSRSAAPTSRRTAFDASAAALRRR